MGSIDHGGDGNKAENRKSVLYRNKRPKRVTIFDSEVTMKMLGDCSVSLPFRAFREIAYGEAAKGLDWGDLNFCEDANEWRLGQISVK